MIRVLVLGADGPVGRRVAAALGSSDWASVVAERRPTAGGDALLDGVDCVANCVTGRPEAIVRTARRLYPAAASLAPRLPIVHLGSMTVYGAARGVVSEETPPSPDQSAYAQAQWAAERLAETHPGTIRLRPGCEYGPDCREWTARIARWLARRRIGDLGAGGDGYCNLLFIDDLVAAILEALRHPQLAGQALNLAAPDPPTWNEYFIRFAKALRAVPVRRVTRRRAAIETRLLAPPLKIAELLLGRAGWSGVAVPPPIPPSLLRLTRQEIRLDARRAEALLGIHWTPLETGLERAARWCREEIL